MEYVVLSAVFCACGMCGGVIGYSVAQARSQSVIINLRIQLLQLETRHRFKEIREQREKINEPEHVASMGTIRRLQAVA